MSVERDRVAGHLLRFLPMDESGRCADDETILDCARRLRVRLASSCGGHGTCMSCSVQITDGAVPAATAADRQAFSERRLEEGWRRACLTRLVGDCTVFVPARSTAQPVRTQVDGSAIAVELDPPVAVHEFALAQPTIGDVRSDDLRLFPAFPEGLPDSPPRIDKAVLETLAVDVRKWNWRGRLVARGPEIVAAQAIGRRMLGMAVDLGTTNVSAFLVDLESGETLAAKGCANPQNSYGADLMSPPTDFTWGIRVYKVYRDSAAGRAGTGKTNAKTDIAAGPNNPVGVYWLGLSKPHWGIHGTPDPSRVGTAETNGCIHLTNWDVLRLAQVVKTGFAVDVHA